MRDEAEIRGHRRTYIGAMPGQIIEPAACGDEQPLFILGEIDKLGSDFRGDPSSALLETLDPEQNGTFRDRYLDVPFDLSKVFFITTANQLDTIPAPCATGWRSSSSRATRRRRRCRLPSATHSPKQIEEHGLRPTQIAFRPEATRRLVRHYTREAGVRNLEREIGSVVRKATRMFAEGHKGKITVNPKFLETALGAPRFLHEEVAEQDLLPARRWASRGPPSAAT